MKHLKIFTQYIKESMTTDVDKLLDNIKDTKVDFFSLHLSNDDYINKAINVIYEDADFNGQLFKENLKKGEIESTTEIENFLRKDIDMKFFFLYSRDDTVLDNPKFLILQYHKNDQWAPVEIYSIDSGVNNFYDNLTAKEIKLSHNDTTYIYSTSNSGNNWELKNSDKKNDNFKENIETDDIKKLIKNGAKLKIIG